MLRLGVTASPAANTVGPAASALRAGGLVAFPTETVYGLGADAFHPEAVARIYKAKGRPGDNPLILHVNTVADAVNLSREWPRCAQQLADAFWPGPLTLVVNKHPRLPAWVGGHPSRQTQTVAVRVPSHGVIRALIAQSGCVIAAPSANRAGTPSATDADHVAADLGGDLDWLLDGGPTPYGLESSVVDVTTETPVILRPGAITAEMIAAVTNPTTHADKPSNPTARAETEVPRSPGQKYRHYAPKGRMTVITGAPDAAAEAIVAEVVATRHGENGAVTGILATAQTTPIYLSRFGAAAAPGTFGGADGEIFSEAIIPWGHGTVILLTLGDRNRPQTIARALYAALRRMDALGAAVIFAEGVDEAGLGAAIMNRLVKAAGGRVQ